MKKQLALIPNILFALLVLSSCGGSSGDRVENSIVADVGDAQSSNQPICIGWPGTTDFCLANSAEPIETITLPDGGTVSTDPYLIRREDFVDQNWNCSQLTWNENENAFSGTTFYRSWNFNADGTVSYFQPNSIGTEQLTWEWTNDGAVIDDSNGNYLFPVNNAPNSRYWVTPMGETNPYYPWYPGTETIITLNLHPDGGWPVDYRCTIE